MSWRQIACPNCGERFNNPILTHKRFTGGFSIYPMGTITCPKCGYIASSYKYKRPKPGDKSPTPSPQESKPEPSDSDQKKLDESKFERL
ncbi:MAG: hypothetical protein ABSA11_04480 [Candidatus Bathyarchaeia archaeon]